MNDPLHTLTEGLISAPNVQIAGKVTIAGRSYRQDSDGNLVEIEPNSQEQAAPSPRPHAQAPAIEIGPIAGGNIVQSSVSITPAAEPKTGMIDRLRKWFGR